MADVSPETTSTIATAIYVVARVVEAGLMKLYGLFKKNREEDKALASDKAKWDRINQNTADLAEHDKVDIKMHTEILGRLSRIEEDSKEMKGDIKTLLRRNTGRV